MDYETRFMDGLDEVTRDLLEECALECPDILPDEVCAINEVPDAAKIKAWAQAFVDTHDVLAAQDLFCEADRALANRAAVSSSQQVAMS